MSESLPPYTAGFSPQRKIALGRSTSRDRPRLRLAGPRSLRSRGRRCAPRACGACGVGGRSRRFAPCARETPSAGGRDGLALSESTRTVAGSPSTAAGWTGVCVTARPARRCRTPRRSRPTIRRGFDVITKLATVFHSRAEYRARVGHAPVSSHTAIHLTR